MFLVRHPFASLRSLKQRNWDRLDHPHPLTHFALRWAQLAHEFRRVEGGHLLRYEDLIGDGAATRALGDYLEIRGLSESFIRESHVDGWSRKRDVDPPAGASSNSAGGAAMREWDYRWIQMTDHTS